MTEERNFGWRASERGDGLKLIEALGGPPLMVRRIRGALSIKRPDAGSLKVLALDHRGYPLEEVGRGNRLELLEDVLYYIVEG